MMATLNFHVRHEVTPERIWNVLDALANGLEYDHITQYDRQLSRMRQLGFVTGRGEVELTPDGLEMYRMGMKRLEIVWEIMHFLHYTYWLSSHPTQNTLFFTYRAYCDLLYTKHNMVITSQRDQLAAEMTDLLTTSQYFRGLTSNLAKGAVSLSVNSLVGVEHWLIKLSPEVITDGKFSLRHYCSSELLLMALGYLTTITEAQLGLDQPLTQERRELLCRICLLEDEALNQILDWLFLEYPDFVQPGTTTGNYGRFVRVMALPTLKDLLL